MHFILTFNRDITPKKKKRGAGSSRSTWGLGVQNTSQKKKNHDKFTSKQGIPRIDEVLVLQVSWLLHLRIFLCGLLTYVHLDCRHF